jgi:hypothetical protein
MEIQTVVSHINFLFEKSIGIWFAAWVIRYRVGWDFKLSSAAKLFRWAVVGIGYLLGASLPGPGVVRLVPGLIGLCFLCWPNFAYHLGKIFAQWPKAEGRVVFTSQTEDAYLVGYSFIVGSETRGGTATIKVRNSPGNQQPYHEGQKIAVAFDPLNLNQSEIVA